MYQLVSNDSLLRDACDDINDNLVEGIGADTETYGVERSDRAFSLQLATRSHVWYFNFHDYGDGVPVMDRRSTFRALARLLGDKRALWFIHNAKFDMWKLLLEDIRLSGGVHCTQSVERFIYNQYLKYSLAACLERRGRKKDDEVAAYIDKHKLWTGTGDSKRKHFEKVPFPTMFRYACIDAEEVRWLGLDQRRELGTPDYYLNDLEMQKVAFEMEVKGMHVRTDYAQGGLEYEQLQQASVAEQLGHLAGEPFRSGPNWLRGIFDKHGVPYRVNVKTGNPIFNKDALDEIDHPIAGLIRKYRKHEKYGGTYYDYYRTRELIHAEIKLHGTDTGRFSYAEPNLQNVPKEETLDASIPFQVRGCFVPQSTDHCLVAIDFNQQEFRLMLDYAGEHELIRRINDHGEDVHQATADLVGVTRKQAKTINFGLLYGMGVEKLAAALGISIREAKILKAGYFSKLPKVQRLIEAIIKKAERSGFVETWVGRRLYVPSPWRDPDTKKLVRFEYVMPNHLIQGGCGDIARIAMPRIAALLSAETTDTAMQLQVHDELLFQVHKTELGIVPDIVRIMEQTYKPFNGMKMTCGVDHSWVSWGKRDVISGYPEVPALVLS